MKISAQNQPQKTEKAFPPVVVKNIVRKSPPIIVVKMPRVKSQRQIMHRNASGDIDYTTTVYEYEE